jgi:signal transduction histidine kinase
MTRESYVAAAARTSEAIATRPHATGAMRIALAALCAGVVSAIAFVDYLTDVRVSLGIFYLVPTVLAAVLLGAWPGTVIAALGAGAWVLADALLNRRNDPWWLLVGNGVLRFLPMMLVVLLVVDLRRILARAQRSERQAREFLAFAAHQLRTPVAGVQATAEVLILQRNGSGDQERLLSNLAGEASRVGRLVRSLLRVARLDQGEPADVRPQDPRTVCEAEIARFRDRTAVPIALSVTSAVPAAVGIDSHDLTEILSILLENACRHAETSIDGAVDIGHEGLRLTVRDDGPGLPAGAEARAFDRFVSLDRHGGSGLGLSIASGLAEKHRGTLTYELGAFVLVLPV